MTDRPRMRFASGNGTAFAVGAGVALVGAGADSPAALAIERSMIAGESLEQLMTTLSSVGFSNLPSFAMVVADGDSVRLLFRGEIVVRLVGVDGSSSTHYQPTIATWREELVGTAAEVHAELRGEGADVGPGTPYWMLGGVVSAGRLIWPLAMAAQKLVDANVVAVHVDLAGSPPLATGEGLVVPPVFFAPPSVGNLPPQALAVASESGPGIAEAADDLDIANFVDHTVYHRAEDAAVRPVEAHDEDQALVAPSASTSARSPAAADPAESVDLSLKTLMPDRDRPVASSQLIDVLPGSSAAIAPKARAGDVDDPDHDGRTVARASKKALPPKPATDGGGPAMVQAVFCPQNHPNPSNASTCRVCKSPIASRTARMTARPSLGVLRFSTGRTAPVNGPLVIGRSPSAGQIVDGELAVLVEIDNSELSRLHATVHVTEWFVHVADQGSTNGTTVIVPGKPPQTLRPLEKVQIPLGSTVDLGGAVTFEFEPG